MKFANPIVFKRYYIKNTDNSIYKTNNVLHLAVNFLNKNAKKLKIRVLKRQFVLKNIG